MARLLEDQLEELHKENFNITQSNTFMAARSALLSSIGKVYDDEVRPALTSGLAAVKETLTTDPIDNRIDVTACRVSKRLTVNKTFP